MTAFKTGLVLGLGAGYVLGTRAGRERYDQISRVTKQAWDSQTGRRVRTEVVHAMPTAVSAAVEKVGELRHRNGGGIPSARIPA